MKTAVAVAAFPTWKGRASVGQAYRDNELACSVFSSDLDKTAAGQAGKHLQKQRSQEVFYSRNGFRRLVRCFKIANN